MGHLRINLVSPILLRLLWLLEEPTSVSCHTSQRFSCTRRSDPEIFTVAGNGYDLLNSLVSPGPTTPIQPDTVWSGKPEWDSPMHGFFGQGAQLSGQMRFLQSGYAPNMQQDYISLGDEGEEDTYDPEHNLALNNTQLGGWVIVRSLICPFLKPKM